MRKGRALKLKTIAFFLIGMVVFISLGLALRLVKQLGFIPIQRVSLIEPLHNVNPELIKAAVTDEVKRGFFALNVQTICDKLMQVPWVASVYVQRNWPDSVQIRIQERKPLAIWEKKGVIDTEGKLFFPSDPQLIKGELPEFYGEESQVAAMLDTYLLILSKLKPLGLSVKKLEIMPDHGWRAMLDNGITIILGQVELEERLTRFVLAYGDSKSGVMDDKVKVVDLRYTNGLAILSQ